MTETVLFTGKTRTAGGKEGYAKSADGFLDIKLAQAHPAAEVLFGAAWSACYIAAFELAAQQKNVKLPASLQVDAEIDLVRESGAFFLRARLNVRVPDVDPATAREVADLAHTICPYSKAVHGNIDIQTNVLEATAAAA